MWELNYRENWALKNWVFWPVVLEKTLESPLDCKETQPVHSKGDEPSFFGGVLWRNWCWSWNSNTLATSCKELSHWERPWCWERLRAGGEGDERMRWLDGITDSADMSLGKTPEVDDGQGGLACCGSWGRKESNMTERLKWTELNWIFHCVYVQQLTYRFNCQRTSRLFPCPSYCKQCCDEHWGTRVSFTSGCPHFF